MPLFMPDTMLEMNHHPFRGRTVLVATQHGKEQAIGPVLEAALGVRVQVAAVDTDRLGTFSGEVSRTLDPLEAARQKCRDALALGIADLAVASEGSFLPHPAIGFIPADEELLVLMDAAHGWEVAVKRLSTETNFAAAEVSHEPGLLDFAARAGFPAHALILRERRDGMAHLRKGITSREELLAHFAHLHRLQGHAWVETDMRAHLNPTRMKVITEAAHKLAEAALSLCPACQRPGFTLVDAEAGLPCALCGSPTHATLAHVMRCAGCAHEVRIPFPKGRATADPQHCDYCNP